jgi:hypothetical protein
MLKDQDLVMPKMINLPDILDFFNIYIYKTVIQPAEIDFDKIQTSLKDLRCWVKHFYADSKIPELTRIKAL